MGCIYILQLENDCWYVGHAEDFKERLKQHTNKKQKATWIQRNPFIAVTIILQNLPKSEESLVTLDLMCLYGVDKVRGGAYTSVHADLIMLQKRISTHSPKHILLPLN